MVEKRVAIDTCRQADRHPQAARDSERAVKETEIYPGEK